MTALPITIATGNYDRVKPLIDGQVTVEGCDVNYLVMSIEESGHRAFASHEFDVTELSCSIYMVGRSRGLDDYIAIPVFPSRSFRHSAIYIRDDRGIAHVDVDPGNVDRPGDVDAQREPGRGLWGEAGRPRPVARGERRCHLGRQRQPRPPGLGIPAAVG